MSRIKSTNTSLELKVRKYLFANGYRYKLHSTLIRKPDLLFSKQRVAVFVNGCFWHMHGCNLSKIPTSRREFWEKKLNRNKARDIEVEGLLKELGWKTIRIWECEVNNNIEKATYDLICIIAKKFI